jgi:hypothetical protein
MPEAQSSAPSTGRPVYQVPESGPLPDRALYERLVGDGIVAADRQGRAIDHVTARRLAILLASRPQPPDFAQGLVRFARTGAITQALRTQLRVLVRSGSYADHHQAARLMDYCISRATDPGPIGENFARACDQIDRADVMLKDLRERARQGLAVPAQAAPGVDRPTVVALAGRDPESRTVSLILDENTASLAIFAVAAQAEEREAHVREVQRYGQTLPEGSYGRANRETIAAREERVAARLRAVERAYQAALDRDAAPAQPDSAIASYPPGQAADREIELE